MSLHVCLAMENFMKSVECVKVNSNNAFSVCPWYYDR